MLAVGVRLGCALVLAPAMTGCGVDCGSPSQVDGAYAVFANVLDFDGTNLEAFPSYMSPANGWTEWDLEWPARGIGPVLLAIDGQPYEATGTWNDIECGRFSLEVSGTYSSIRESVHVFDASGEFVAFGSRIEGVWDWAEDWTARDGATGTFTASGQVSGRVLDEG